MSDYEIALLWGAVLLIASVLSGFTAVTNQRSVVVAMVLFVIGGFALYYAQSLNPEGVLAADLPKAVYKLYSRVLT